LIIFNPKNFKEAILLKNLQEIAKFLETTAGNIEDVLDLEITCEAKTLEEIELEIQKHDPLGEKRRNILRERKTQILNEAIEKTKDFESLYEFKKMGHPYNEKINHQKLLIKLMKAAKTIDQCQLVMNSQKPFFPSLKETPAFVNKYDKMLLTSLAKTEDFKDILHIMIKSSDISKVKYCESEASTMSIEKMYDLLSANIRNLKSIDESFAVAEQIKTVTDFYNYSAWLAFKLANLRDELSEKQEKIALDFIQNSDDYDKVWYVSIQFSRLNYVRAMSAKKCIELAQTVEQFLPQYKNIISSEQAWRNGYIKIGGKSIIKMANEKMELLCNKRTAKLKEYIGALDELIFQNKHDLPGVNKLIDKIDTLLLKQISKETNFETAVTLINQYPFYRPGAKSERPKIEVYRSASRLIRNSKDAIRLRSECRYDHYEAVKFLEEEVRTALMNEIANINNLQMAEEFEELLPEDIRFKENNPNPDEKTHPGKLIYEILKRFYQEEISKESPNMWLLVRIYKKCNKRKEFRQISKDALAKLYEIWPETEESKD